MRSTLRTDGYVVVPGLLAEREVVELRDGVRRVRTTRAASSCARPNNTLIPLRWDDDAVGAVLTDADRVARIEHAAEATDLRWVSGYYSLKAPRSGPLWWHQDWWCWKHPATMQARAPQVALLCYLDDTTTGTGALRVLPGSHRESAPIHAVLPDAHRDPRSALQHGHPVVSDQPGQVSLDVCAGDAVLLDYRVVHGTHANTSERSRWCLILNFAPAWDELHDDLRAHLVGGLALPNADERAAAELVLGDLLPRYDGCQRDLELSRDAPATFSYALRSAAAEPASSSGGTVG